MEKLPLTPDGVKQLQQILYALPNPLLQDEARALQNNFKKWIKNHFDLRPDQENFLDHLTDGYINYTAVRCSFALANRLPINFIVPSNPGSAKPSGETEGKRIKSLDKTSYSSEEEDPVDGSVDIEVSY